MVRHHPQWIRAREEVRRGAIGKLQAIQCAFSYFNDDPTNIRNIPAHGGGALYDIGVYPIVTSRYLFETEPVRVMACIERDPAFGTDRLLSAVLDFGVGQASFVCSTQMVPYQRVQVFGTEKRLEIEIPFNAPSEQKTRMFIDDGVELGGSSAAEIDIADCDQYRLQGEAFSRHIRQATEPEFPLEDSLKTMRVVEALFASAETGCWVVPGD